MGKRVKWLLAGGLGVAGIGGAWWLAARQPAPTPPALSPAVSAVPQDHTLALGHAEVAARQKPDDPELAVEAGGLAGDQGRYREALRWFEKAQRRDPKLLPAISGQGQMWMALGRPGRAAAKYEQALKLAPDEPRLWLELARAYLMLRDFPQALHAAEAAEKLAPANPQVHRAKALVYADVMAREQSRQSAQRACELQPDDPENWATLASLELRNNGFDAAETALKRALALDPAHTSANLLYAQVLTNGRKTPAAEREAFAILARLRVLEPGNPQALLQQAQILLRAGQVPLAVSLLQQAREAAPRDSAILLALGQALGRTGKVEEGVKLTVQAQQLAPKGVSFTDLEELVAKNPDPVLVMRLADLYARNDLPDSAVHVLERAVRRAPGNEALRAKLVAVRARTADKVRVGG
ncbi:MAG: Tetratricopeptide 2 repeat protein [Armatimonadetes bacterium]|nr:Tetratricopeptide 2 repeat protein [Armatimonadota bacterium]